MIFLNDFLSLVKFKITGGSEYLWNCFGNKARILDHDTENYNISVIFNTETQEIYEINFNANTLNDPTYRHPHFFWVNAAMEQALFDEAKERNVNLLSLDEATVVQVTSYEEALNYIMENTGLTLGEEIDLELDNDVILWLTQTAIKQNITFNALLNNILRQSLNDGSFQKIVTEAHAKKESSNNETT